MASLVLGGCARDLQSNVRLAEKAFGIPIELNAKADDECLVKQLEVLYRSYQKLSRSDAAAARDSLRSRYTKIVLNASVLGQSARGTLVYLSLGASSHGEIRPYGDYTRQYTELESKCIGNRMEVTGTLRATQVSRKNGVLTLTPQFKSAQGVTIQYQTFNPILYRQVDRDTEAAFAQGRDRGEILWQYRMLHPNTCGESISLSHLF